MIDFFYGNNDAALPETLNDEVSLIVSKLEAFSFRFIKFSATKTFPEQNFNSGKKKIKFSAIGEKKHITDLLSKFTSYELEKINLDLKCCLQIGQKFPRIKALSYPDGIEKSIKFAKNDNKLYIVEYWQEITGIIEKIKSYSSYFMNHPEHERIIQIIYFVPENFISNELRKIVDDYMCAKVNFYIINQNKLAEKRILEIYPENCTGARIIHFGRIVSLEQNLDKALRGYFNSIKNEKKVKNEWYNIPDNQYQRLFANISDKFGEINELFPNLNKDLSFRKHKITSKNPIKFNHKFRLYIVWKDFKKYLPTVDSLQNYFYQLIPKNSISLNINCLAEEFCERGVICNLCHRELDEDENHYLCIECNPKHYHCEKCHQKKYNGEGLKQFAHPHCLYLIISESTKLDEIMIGNERYTSEHFNGIEFCRYHRKIVCDNRYNPLNECEGTVEGTRYKCVHCRDYNFCGKCMKKWLEGGSDAMIKTAKERGHEKWHVFMLVESSFYRYD